MTPDDVGRNQALDNERRHPMCRRASLTLSLLLPLAALAPPAPAQAADGSPDPQQVTIDRIREVGVALFGYLTDHPVSASSAGGGDDERHDWSGCPALSHREATALLVPEYLKVVPATDGWGHPLELCLRRVSGPGGSIGVRSAGRDGRFEGTSYQQGAFPSTRLDADLVWIDGYFVRWPEKPAPSE
jgi:hypothetical protein